MADQIKKIGVLTSGGDCQAMNAAVRAVVLSARKYNIEVVGIQGGYYGAYYHPDTALRTLSAADVENIINEVSRTFNVSAADIRSDKRNANISQARQVAIYIVDQVTGLSLKSIGSEFGNKHHSTIIYALKEIKGKIEKDVALKSTVDDIIKNINLTIGGFHVKVS